jgi:hypothetical protein
MTNELPTLEEVRAMVVNRPDSVTLSMIAASAKVSTRWLDLLIKGEIPNPGYNSVRNVYSFLLSRGI